MKSIFFAACALLFTALFPTASRAEEAIFDRLDQPTTIDSGSTAAEGTADTRTTLTILFTLSSGNAEITPGLKAYLEEESNYSFSLQRRGTQNNTAAIQDKTLTGDPARDSATVTKSLLGMWKITYVLGGNTAARVAVAIKAAPANAGYQIKNKGADTPGATVELGAPATFKDLLPVKFDLNLSGAWGAGNPSVSVNGEGRLSARPGHMTTLSLAGEVPVTVPSDVKRLAGGNAAASGKQPDGLQLGLNLVNFTGTKLEMGGIRARTQAAIGAGKTFDGSEFVGYYAPIIGWSKDNRRFHAVEIEGGWRDGKKEWVNLTTRAADKGNLVGRVGTVLEWQPVLGRINLNPTEKLRFFVRGRYWLDSYNEGKDWRGRGFLDSELFFNFGGSYRLFLRGEYGMLPPDLSRTVSRLSVGVGKAF